MKSTQNKKTQADVNGVADWSNLVTEMIISNY